MFKLFDSRSDGFVAALGQRGFPALLAALVVLMQYPLWLGEGGWLAVRVGATKLEKQEALNQRLRERNDALLAEVGDLKQGRDAIEERARSELGMIAPDEIFVRVLTASATDQTPAVSSAGETSATPSAGEQTAAAVSVTTVAPVAKK